MMKRRQGERTYIMKILDRYLIVDFASLHHHACFALLLIIDFFKAGCFSSNRQRSSRWQRISLPYPNDPFPDVAGRNSSRLTDCLR
jgi:hypothetical protein